MREEIRTGVVREMAAGEDEAALYEVVGVEQE